MFTKTAIEKYFIAEKSGSLLFIFIGIAAIALAIVFLLLLKTNFYKGMAIPFLLIGMVQLTFGFTVFKRSDDDRKRNTYAFDLKPADLKLKEIPRMEKVARNFVIYRWAEIALFAAGVLLIFLFRQHEATSFLYGLGIAFVLLAIILLITDYFAEKRAKNYLDGLKSFVEQVK